MSAGPNSSTASTVACCIGAGLALCLGLSLAGCSADRDPRAAFQRGDYGVAFQLWESRAAAGDLEALNFLGIHRQLGLGVPRDPVAAAHWYRKAARLGHAGAQRNLATLYRSGVGVARDNQLAYGWYHYAARQGNPVAQNFIEVMTDDLTGNQIAQARRQVRRELQYDVEAADIAAQGKAAGASTN